MLTELNGIYNPTLRERMERGVVSMIIGTKKRIGEIWAADLVEMQAFIFKVQPWGQVSSHSD